MATLKIHGVDIYYELYGQGKPLVLIAGYCCDHTFWNAMLHELAEEFQILIFDNRGIGQTRDDGGSFTLEAQADDIMAFLEQLGFRNPSILGQSMGGAIAQLLARKHGKKISKLVILNSVAKFNTRANQAMESLLNLRKENISFDLLIEAGIPWFFSSEYLAEPKNIAAFKENLKNNPYPQSLQDQARQFRSIPPFDSRGWLHEIKVPTLVIAAEDDILTLPAESQQLAQGIPNAQFITIPGGHSSPLEHPALVNDAILKFLTSS
ncbi:TPA: alpha/beta fold hydrolase [Legionella pneumophila]|uniref:alpha/beta fold hydrolase n=1 Tax=Legionella pneumophila TaxID=446 RepID=UPI000D079DE4|nr:alpha/beta hydrolase [Legionella pneumophila]MDF1930880.1 alpha/beta hydrolase [Legionella pneumophila]MDW8901214.1 alpha/beta hydrolase [Legionella pneumophila]MDW8906067.1 alpha/beta hydrolase [Legionella pneumophila]MDW9177277.1 alpha/beta hydrolase [Legionella pneumophila]PYB43589.1 alpha/beta hydrolase [Legionella pneumophila]